MTSQHDKRETVAAKVAPKVAAMVAEGYGRNEISRRLFVSTGTVTAAARIAGVTFDQAVTPEGQEAATATRQKTTAERREAYGNRWGALQILSTAELVKRLQTDPGSIETHRLITLAGVSADKWLKYVPEADAEAESEEEAKRAIQALHEAILASVPDDPPNTHATNGITP